MTYMRTLAAVAAVVVTGAVGLGPAAVSAQNSNEVPYPIPSSLPDNVQNFLRVETSPAVFNVDYHYGNTQPAANGAYQRNVGTTAASWYIEDQRYGAVDVIGGVLHHDLPLLRTGLKMFDFAFDREASNGSFPGSDGHSLFHGTAFFLAAAGPAMLVLKDWVREPNLPGNLPSHINWEIARLKAAATYLVNRWWRKPGHIDDGGKEERKFEGAVSLQSIGVLAGDSWLEQKAAVYAREGMAMTEPSGIWTEHGITKLCCHDSSYQAVGLVYGTRYLALLNPTGSFYQQVYKTVQLGEQWEFSRTSPNGSVNRSGDDRTGPTCPEKSTGGGCKSVDLQAVASALMRWYEISKDFTYNRRAYYVALQLWLQNPANHLPAPGLTISPHDYMSITQIDYHYPFFVAGARFEPYEPVKVYFGGTLVGETTTDAGGSFGGHSPVGSVKFTPAVTTAAGRYTVKAVGAYGITRTATISITAGAPRAAFAHPSSHTSTQIGRYRFPFYLGATGFLPSDQVTIYWGSQSLGTYTCDLTGAFGGKSGTGPFNVYAPTSKPGTYTLTVKDGSGRSAYANVSITSG